MLAGMDGWRVDRYDDPAEVLAVAGDFLASRPVEHNLVLTLLNERVAHPEPGRYWIVSQGSAVVGVVFQSPLDFLAAVTPLPPPVTAFVAESIAGTGTAIPGVNSEAATAAAFAGQWTESTGCGAHPDFGQRLYAFTEPAPVADVAGFLRQAQETDSELLIEWFDEFQQEAAPSAPSRDHRELVPRRIKDGRLWVWEVDGVVTTFSGLTGGAAGVARIGPVFTPREQRRQGYAGACVGALSRMAADRGETPILFTDLANPTSNRLYRRLGYRVVLEVMVYKFHPRVAAEAGVRL